MIKDFWGNTKNKQEYPDLLVHFENKDMIVELERTRKSKERFENKLDSYYQYLQDGKEILWLIPNESVKKIC